MIQASPDLSRYDSTSIFIPSLLSTSYDIHSILYNSAPIDCTVSPSEISPIIMASFLTLVLLLASVLHITAFPHLAQRSGDAVDVPAPTKTTAPASTYTWSPSQLVDVTGAHAYADPLPGQARGPCPAQNALANHGYMPRSGYTSLLLCIAANGQVYNMAPDFATFLCFLGQLTGGDLIGATWSIGNSSAFDSMIKAACPCIPLLGCTLTNLLCYISNILDKALGTAGFGMAQTHNSVRLPNLLFLPRGSFLETLYPVWII
jgi:hypothetical protein